MPKYRGAEEDEIERLKRWLRGVFLRPPPPIALEVKLNRGDEGEAQLLRLERDDLATSPEVIAEHIYDECKGESDRLTGMNRFAVYLYRENYKEGRRPHGHFLFKVDSPEDEQVMGEIQRTEPQNEKGFTQALMRFFSDNQRAIASERERNQRHMESMVGMLSTQVQKLAEQQLQVIDITNQALDRKEERAIAVRRELQKDQYAELAAKTVFPLLGPLVGKVLARFGGGAVPTAQATPQQFPLETQITFQLNSFLNTFEQPQADAFKGLLNPDQMRTFQTLLTLIAKRDSVGPSIDIELASSACDFIGSFDDEQVPKLATIINPAQVAAFMELFELIKTFQKNREQQTPKAAE